MSRARDCSGPYGRMGMALVMSTEASSMATRVTRTALRIVFICVTTSSTATGSP